MAPQEPLQDIRYSYDINRSNNSTRDSLDCQDEDAYFYRPSYSNSDRSYHTQPSDYSTSPVYPTKRPALLHHHDTCPNRIPPDPAASNTSSINTYTSTIPSIASIAKEEQEQEHAYSSNTPPSYHSTTSLQPIPATPSDFSELFPSPRRLDIRHDDTTLDGNMNLRIDTHVLSDAGQNQQTITLFHLRMHDLKTRDFSLRRYHRDSGREVCHSVRKTAQQPKPPAAAVTTGSVRPSLQRSMTSALRTLRSKSEHKASTLTTSHTRDSGYSSTHSSDPQPTASSSTPRPQSAHNPSQLPPQPKPKPKTLSSKDSSIKLEFANYAQTSLNPRSSSTSKRPKRWDFEYWGLAYSWRKVFNKKNRTSTSSSGGGGLGFEYQLTRTGRSGGGSGGGNGGRGEVLAYIVPVPLTPEQGVDERAKGGWVPPCRLWVVDETVLKGEKDVVDVVVATALIALVDDAIATNFGPTARDSSKKPSTTTTTTTTNNNSRPAKLSKRSNTTPSSHHY
ncbi:hypothetical protein MBLNU230_g3296t1 [Neophaeotheca triangularis]